MKYQCEVCRCYLDPGEGFLCDECRDKMQKRIRNIEILDKFLFVDVDSGQIKMRMEKMA